MTILAMTIVIFVWAFFLVHIWNDADATFGTGWLWAMCVLFAPPIAIPGFYIYKYIVHRKTAHDLRQSDLKEQRDNLKYRPSEMTRFLERELGVSNNVNPETDSSYLNDERVMKHDFTPYEPRFRESVEKFVNRRIAGRIDKESNLPF